MIRKNLLGKNTDYAEMHNKYGFSVFTVSASKKTVKFLIPTSQVYHTLTYKTLKELNELVNAPDVMNIITEGYINEKKNGKIYTYHVLKTTKGFEFILDHTQLY